MPSPAALAYLALMLLLVPYAAIKSARRLRAGVDEPPRPVVFRSIAVVQAVMLGVSLLVAWSFEMPLFPKNWPRWQGVAVGLGALAVLLGLIPVRVKWRDPVRERALSYVLPHRPRELGAFAAVCLLVGFAEEFAYRGVLMGVVWWLVMENAGLGAEAGWWVSALICTAAFTAAHAAQGWVAAVVIAGVALAMHLTVKLSGNLYAAMGVHAVYDFAAGAAYVYWIRPRWEAEGTAKREVGDSCRPSNAERAER